MHLGKLQAVPQIECFSSHSVTFNAQHLITARCWLILSCYLVVNGTIPVHICACEKFRVGLPLGSWPSFCFENHCSTQGYRCSYVLHLQNHKSDIKFSWCISRVRNKTLLILIPARDSADGGAKRRGCSSRAESREFTRRQNVTLTVF